MSFKVKQGVIVDRQLIADPLLNISVSTLNLDADIESVDYNNGTIAAVGGMGVSNNVYVGNTLSLIRPSTFQNNFTANSDLNINGNLTVNGSLIKIDSVTVVVKDKNLELNAVTLPTNLNADQGGLILKGTTDKTFLWNVDTQAWTSNQDLDILTGHSYYANGSELLNETDTLGASVVFSSLTTVGTLTELTSSGVVTILDTTNSWTPLSGALTMPGGAGIGKNLVVGGNFDIESENFLKLPVGTTDQQPGRPGQPNVSSGGLRFNSEIGEFEGYNGGSWGSVLGSSAAVNEDSAQELAFAITLVMV